MELIAHIYKLEEIDKFLGTVGSGSVVEVGVYQGGSLNYLASRHLFRTFYGYDTFEGMPVESSEDNFHKQGNFTASLEETKESLKSLPNVQLIKGYYPNSDIIRPCPLAVAHVDVDLYESTYLALKHLAPLMLKGGRIYCDDAFVDTCEGATLALCRFCSEYAKVPSVVFLRDNVIQTYIQF